MLSTNELLRLKALEEYDILDTLPEDMFDDITAIAAAICNVPIAFIGLIDDKRQFFKSRIGLDMDNVPLNDTICQHMINGEESFMEISDLRVDERFKDNPYVHGNPNLVSYSGAALSTNEGTTIGTICVMDYETKSLNEGQKKALKSLSKHVVHLLELRKSNNLLNSYQKKLEEFAKNTEEFSYMAAHDLKAPIRGIDSFVKLIEKKNADHWDEKDKKYLGIIHDSCMRMNALIQDLMAFSKSGIGDHKTEEIDVREIAMSTFSDLTKIGFEVPPVLSMGKMPKINSYRVPLQILFQNIMENGLKYQTPNKTPHLQVSFRETLSAWEFEIRDNGIGIEDQYLESIFQPFQRLQTQKEYPGSGLGLASCKKLIHQLKGNLWATSKVGEGTSFFFTLPK